LLRQPGGQFQRRIAIRQAPATSTPLALRHDTVTPNSRAETWPEGS